MFAKTISLFTTFHSLFLLFASSIDWFFFPHSILKYIENVVFQESYFEKNIQRLVSHIHNYNVVFCFILIFARVWMHESIKKNMNIIFKQLLVSACLLSEEHYCRSPKTKIIIKKENFWNIFFFSLLCQTRLAAEKYMKTDRTYIHLTISNSKKKQNKNCVSS